MNKKTMLMLVMLLLLSCSFSSMVSADVIVFDRYDTDTVMEDGKLVITKQLRLRNVGPNPIIPGEIHFKLSQEGKKGLVAPDIEGFSVVDRSGKTLETREVTTQQEASLIFTVWDPLLPNFVYEMTMKYELPFKARGVLFYQVLLPEERTTIPIRGSSTTFTIPKRFHVTHFSPEGTLERGAQGTTIDWDVKEAYYVEYSVIPFPRVGIKAVNVFWALIIALFLTHLFFRMRKKALADRQ